ncbi:MULTISPECIES: hypothetical protein [Stenotrophomonas]|nr:MULTISPECIES: hypothetical protein [Stenotrophomonas]
MQSRARARLHSLVVPAAGRQARTSSPHGNAGQQPALPVRQPL